ncbi:MAG: DUF2277 domain-containing protein [Acidobacteriota bacterium]|nr:DUF2277 domain-containing protein [Acidobacteriota bacterium]
MCRSIKVLRRAGHTASAEELSGAALQFVRKISGFHKPSKANEEAFGQAVREITDSSARLLRAIEAAAGKTARNNGDRFDRQAGGAVLGAERGPVSSRTRRSLPDSSAEAGL